MMEESATCVVGLARGVELQLGHVRLCSLARWCAEKLRGELVKNIANISLIV